MSERLGDKNSPTPLTDALGAKWAGLGHALPEGALLEEHVEIYDLARQLERENTELLRQMADVMATATVKSASAVSSIGEKPQEPVGTGTMFHWRDFIFFGMKDDGTVRIKQYANQPASPPWADEPEHQIGMVFDISIPPAEWQSILGFTAPGLIKDRKSIVAMTGLLAQARRERDTALSATETLAAKLNEMDAARYRWLKTRLTVPGAIPSWLRFNNWSPDTKLEPSIDAAIDKAMNTTDDTAKEAG